jgi:hypothetical protein
MPMLSVCTWVDCVGLCIGSSQWEEGGSGFLSKGGLFFVSGEGRKIKDHHTQRQDPRI